MTTAHRPTFDPAQGKEAQRGPAYHQRLLPAHTILKQRKAGQGGSGGLGQGESQRRDLRAELLAAEAAARGKQVNKSETYGEVDVEKVVGGNETLSTLGATKPDEIDDEEHERKRRRLILEETHAIDAESESNEEDDSSDSSSSDESEDQDANLMRELAKIKAERAEKAAAEQAERARQEEEQRSRDIATGNPLLNLQNQPKQDFGVKRRWDDDVVFKNQARGTEERGKKKEFVNDLLRSDFHKRFMSKYVR